LVGEDAAYHEDSEDEKTETKTKEDDCHHSRHEGTCKGVQHALSGMGAFKDYLEAPLSRMMVASSLAIRSSLSFM
jgi:hypothetical protein